MIYPFIYGAQYYRAPTPDRAHWEEDLRRMADNGFNAVKFWAQWRWAHRGRDQFYFDDLDELMDIAQENGLSVTINLIFDTAPSWMFDAYPDCLMVTSSGQALQSRTTLCRQIGGYPGPCMNHSKARVAREHFLFRTVERYATHPAMSMWDVWNEPESCLFLREPREETLLCYCDNCHGLFQEWLRARYGDIEHLNQVWGRCYGNWREVELPRDRLTFVDMVDFRLFNAHSLATEARRRIDLVKSVDTCHPVYLHPVPNVLDTFNSITGVDDFQVADGCDCFGGTTNGGPAATIQTVSAARDRVSYNVESHLRAGGISLYPRHLELRDFVDSFVPQMGLGMRGFLHWQYRGETLGAESPAWGLLDTDGSSGVTHAAAVEFWRRLRPVADRLMEAPVEQPEVAILKSTANEIFHWCMHGNLQELHDAVNGYTQLLYEKNVRLAYVDDSILLEGLPASVKLLVMPNCYALYEPVADAIIKWVMGGGTLVCEAHTGAYNLTSGRHSQVLPGLGMAEAFGIRERRAIAVAHLETACQADLDINLPADLAAAANAYGFSGGRTLSLKMSGGGMLLGWSRYAELEGDDLAPMAALNGGSPSVVSRSTGDGTVYYIGTLAGNLWESGATGGLGTLIDAAIETAGIPSCIERWPWLPAGVRLDLLRTPDALALAVRNCGSRDISFSLPGNEPMHGLFTGEKPADGVGLSLAPGQAELIVPEKWLITDDLLNGDAL